MTARTALLASLVGIFSSVAVCAAAPSPDEPAAQPKITGTVSYRERIALPPDASVQVRLDDVSQPEAAPRRIAETTFPTAGKQVPIPFELPYSAADIVAGRRYAVRAKIVADGKTLFSTKTPYPVITRGAPTQLEILVQQAAGGQGGPSEARADGRGAHRRRLEARRARGHARRRCRRRASRRTSRSIPRKRASPARRAATGSPAPSRWRTAA